MRTHGAGTARSKSKKALRILGLVLVLLVLLALGGYAYYQLGLNPYRGTIGQFAESAPLDAELTRAQAEADLRFLYKRLESRHPAWLDGSDALIEAVEAQYAQELAALGETVSVTELWRAASRIAAQLHDGHTWVEWNAEAALYIDDVTQLQTLGRPKDVDGIPVEQLLAVYKASTSFELDFYAEQRFCDSVLTRQAYLELCGVNTADGVTMTFDTDGGEQRFSYAFVPLEQVKGYQPDQNDERWIWYRIDNRRNLAVLTLTACIYNDEYLQTLEAFFHEVRERGITNIALDLRGSGGGNSMVANAFIQYLDVDTYKTWKSAVRFGGFLYKNTDTTCVNEKKKWTFGGTVYVLMDTYTYSAAMDFAMLLGDNDLGTLVGAASGNRPDSYGDCLFFQLPNSKLAVSVSFKKWYRVDERKTGQPLEPDYATDPDRALETVYALLQK